MGASSAAASLASGAPSVPATPPAACWTSAAAASSLADALRSRTSSARSLAIASFSVDWRRSVLRCASALAAFASDSAFTSSGVFFRNEARRAGGPREGGVSIFGLSMSGSGRATRS